MNTFKVGDVVRYVTSGKIGWETEDWAKRAGFLLGNEYVVGSSGVIHVRIRGSAYNIHPGHFELAKNSTKYKPNCIQMPAKRRIKNV